MDGLSDFYTHLRIDIYYKSLTFCVIEASILVSIIQNNNNLSMLRLLLFFQSAKGYLYL